MRSDKQMQFGVNIGAPKWVNATYTAPRRLQFLRNVLAACSNPDISGTFQLLCHFQQQLLVYKNQY